MKNPTELEKNDVPIISHIRINETHYEWLLMFSSLIGQDVEVTLTQWLYVTMEKCIEGLPKETEQQ